MDDVWKTSLHERFDETFDAFDRALRDCPGALWTASLWPVSDRPPIREGLGAELPEVERRQAFSAFWFVAWHALKVVHYDIEGRELPEGWGPPPPFDSYITDRNTLPPRPWTRNELRALLDVTRRRVNEVIGGLTDERIARPVAEGHRYAEKSYAWLLLGSLTHTAEHVAQLDMFLGQRAASRSR